MASTGMSYILKSRLQVISSPSGTAKNFIPCFRMKMRFSGVMRNQCMMTGAIRDFSPTMRLRSFISSA